MLSTKHRFRFHGRAPLLIAVVVGLLSMPAVVGWQRSNALATREMENRNMAAMPVLQLLRKNAPEYIRAMDAYLKDTVGFRIQANALYRKLRYFVFRDPPMPNVTIGRDGHVFLNSPQPAKPYAFFDSLCMQQGDPSPELLQRLNHTMVAASSYFKRRGAQPVFAIAPSTLSLYADKLPLQVAPEYRQACIAYPRRDHLLAQLERLGAKTGLYQVFYPYKLFADHKGEKNFYPKEGYHWEGKPAYLFARYLTQTSGALDELKLDDPAHLTTVKDDLAFFFGFARPVTAYQYIYTDEKTRIESVPWMRKLSEQARLQHVTMKGSLTSKSALMIANSFGTGLAPHLARSFEHFYYLDLNMIQEQEKTAVFAALAERIRTDYVFFVFDDVNTTVIPKFLAKLVQLEELESQRDVLLPKGSSGLEKSGQ